MTLSDLTNDEVRALRRGLKRLEAETRNARKSSMRRGWTPAPGHIDRNVAVLQTVKSLLNRLEYAEDDS
jgi:hypothetical protein